MAEKEKRTVFYGFRVTEAEDIAIREKMQDFGATNCSEFIRAMTLNGIVLNPHLPELHEAVRLLGNLCNNVNQIARRINGGSSIYMAEMEEIIRGQREIQEKLDSLMKRLGCS